MTRKITELKQQLSDLREENELLNERCESLEASQASLLEAISSTNSKLLRSEMTSMELEQVFSACTDPLWVVREDAIVVRANEAMLALLQKPVDAVVGQTCSSLLDYSICEKHRCPQQSKQADGQQEHDIQITSADGTLEDFILTTASLITLDGSPGMVGQFKNITSRKRAEQELEAANQALHRMARVDGLTQIANRRSFDETLEKEWKRLAREGKPLSLLLGDIDFFKKYNDHYGHQAGDDCLQQVGKALSGTALRPADLVARYGGEEFVLLLPEIDINGAQKVGQRVIDSIHGLAIAHHASDIAEVVTMSLGAACLIPSAEQPGSDLIELADQALYQAKASGRNRLVSAPAVQ